MNRNSLGQFAALALATALTAINARPSFGQNAAADTEFQSAVASLFQAGGLTPAEISKRAIATSSEVARKEAEVSSAVLAAQRTELAKIPRLGVSAGYTRLSSIEPPMFAPGVSIPAFFNSYTASAALGIPVSDYVLRIPKIIAAAQKGSDAARSTENATRVMVGAQSITLYYEWMRTRVQTLVAERSLRQIDAALATVRALTEVQRMSRAELLRVESQRASVQQVVAQTRMLQALREEQLRIVIGASADEKLSIGENLQSDVAVPTVSSLASLYAKAMSQRLEIKALDVGMSAKKLQGEAERAGKLPQVTAFAQLDYANPNQRIFPQQDKFNLTWAAGVSVGWTLNDYLANDYTLKGIEADNRQLAADRRRVASGIRLEVMAAMQGIELAQSAISTSQQGLVSAEEGYRVRTELLAAQRATAAEVIDAQTELTRARATALSARVDLRIALAQLHHAIGDDNQELSKK
jgi:outer membrane protein